MRSPDVAIGSDGTVSNGECLRVRRRDPLNRVDRPGLLCVTLWDDDCKAQVRSDLANRCSTPLGAALQIDDLTSKRPLSSVGLGLSVPEARELRDSLDGLLSDPAGRHEHVSSADYQTELTVWIVESRVYAN